jgi:predicted RNA binding protein with dsRBD fold (UPF0201 family)
MAGRRELVVIAEVRVCATESKEKIIKALRNLFGTAEVELEGSNGNIRALCHGYACLERLKSEARLQRIRAALRRLLLENMVGNTTSIYLNKQAAYAGHLIPCETENESPLGPIKLILISNEDLNEVIQSMTA